MIPRTHFAGHIAIVMLLLLQGCSLSVMDHTPDEFPYIGWRDVPDRTLYTTTYDEIRALSADAAHRFLLELEPQNVSNIRAYIIVNGTEHAMVGSGRGLWTYESSDHCQTDYTYYYRILYKAGLYGNKTKLLGNSQEPLTVGVTASGQVSWVIPGKGVFTGDGTVTLDEFDAEDIIVQNLASYPVRIIQLWFHTKPGEVNDNDKFELRDLPQLPYDLACGETVRFRVFWRTVPPDYSDKGLVLLNMAQSAAGNGNYSQGFTAYIDLVGRVVP
jgi:hypothetical protein